MSRPAARAATLIEQDESAIDDIAEIVTGLSLPQKMLSPKYFYDRTGSQLFDEICEQPEYYLTRTELRIMELFADEMAALVGPQASLIEFGSGSSRKTRILLEHLDRLAAYVPVDISRGHLLAAAGSLGTDFPDIEVLPVAADFTHPFPLPEPKQMPLRNLIYFPGSTIGNFRPLQALELLQVMHHEAGENGALLIGVDLKKNVDVLERAYNDSAGVTARFNLNILRRLNRDFGANFDLAGFRHCAKYNQKHGRIEMHLVSRSRQSFSLGGRKFSLRRGESIVTEYSHKYSLEEFSDLASQAGFRVSDVWTDADRMFSVQYCVRQEQECAHASPGGR